jgi:hypothetical protein
MCIILRKGRMSIQHQGKHCPLLDLDESPIGNQENPEEKVSS